MTSMKRKKAKLKTLFKTLNKSLLNKKLSQLINNKHPKKKENDNAKKGERNDPRRDYHPRNNEYRGKDRGG